jgi:hypothetical protein
MKIEDPNKSVSKSFRSNRIRSMDYTDDELLDLLKKYYEKYGKIPSMTDIKRNPDYPSQATYQNHFGSWSNALKLVGFDVDSMVKEGNVSSSYHKARLTELLVFNSFQEKHKAVDLSGKNPNSIFDGLCPRGMSYDVKSASLKADGLRYHFRNKEFDKIEYFYLVAVNEEYTKIYYIWLISRKELRLTNGELFIGRKKIPRYDKYLIDFSKCNLDFLNKKDEKEELL